MVTRNFDLSRFVVAPLAQVTDTPVLDRLDPPKRAAVIMAVLALVLTGMALIAAAMIGAHWVRKLARQRPRNNALSGDALANLQNEHLRASLKELLPKADTADTANTVQINPADSDTKVD